MDKVTADIHTLLSQASMTAGTYLSEAVERIDSTFCEGYAKEHPELVGAFMQAAATDFATSIFTKAVGEFWELSLSFEFQACRLWQSVDRVANAISDSAKVANSTDQRGQSNE